ncbi:MAG: Type II secretion system protein G precursor [Planctomycetes bacterium ADurb.Bin401]|nr:MAG: Type II secretion system protein G precursor [Planctomycetes bacterium ADurb.Bin401]
MMNVLYRKNSKGFSLVELIVVIAVLAVLLAILIPSLSKARLQARVLVVNYELGQIGLALEAYETSNNNWPVTRSDCSSIEHIYSLPLELVKGGYITGTKKNRKTFISNVEDKFYIGHTYKYIAPGPLYDYSGTQLENQYLCISQNFPANTSDVLVKYTDRKTSPVKWVLFSLGPKYDTNQFRSRDWMGFPVDKGFPILQGSWYDKKSGKGILTRIKASSNQFYGTFQK